MAGRLYGDWTADQFPVFCRILFFFTDYLCADDGNLQIIGEDEKADAGNGAFEKRTGGNEKERNWGCLGRNQWNI